MIPIDENWFSSKFKNIYLSLDACHQTDYYAKTGKNCKSKSEIKDFIKENIFYLVNQQTSVGKEIFYDHKKADSTFCEHHEDYE